MARASKNLALGLQQIFPTGDAAYSSTIDIVAIHGLGTESPRTWEYKRDRGETVNWLADHDMLPAVLPNARIFTYNWNANYFKDAPVQTLLGHADTLLAHVDQRPGLATQPLIFVASCFGGLILAQAIKRAAEEGNAHRHVIHSTVGVIFLATPFRGSDAAEEARWQVIVGGIMGEQTSQQLVDDLNRREKHLRELTQTFAEIARRESIQLPLCCFYETKKTELLRRFLQPGLATRISAAFKGTTHKILVTQDSACLDTYQRLGLDATHSGMNKFSGPESADFKLVKKVIRDFVDNASRILENRKKVAHDPHWIVPFGRNYDFVERTISRKQDHEDRELILDWLLKRIPPDVDANNCQRTAIQGLGGVGKTQIALEAAFRVRDQHPDCSVFWVPAVDTTSFENAYREIGQKLMVPGIYEDQADVKILVKHALSHKSSGSWLLIVDNADDTELLFGNDRTTQLCEFLPFSLKGSILVTTRNKEVVMGLDIRLCNSTTITEMTELEAIKMLQTNLEMKQTSDSESTAALLKLLAYLPLAIKQASAYMFKTGMSTSRYLQHCRSNEETLIDLLSKEAEYEGRYKGVSNAVAVTWLISFQHVSRHKPLAARILRIVCFIAATDIPVSLFLHGEIDLEVDEAIGILKSYAFITDRENPGLFDVHQLVQLAMRKWLEKKGEREEWLEKTIQLLADVFPFPKHENRDIWRELLPHALTAVTFENHDVDRVTDVDLLFNIAESHAILGKYKEAEMMHRQTLSLREKVLGKDHLSTLESINNLAEVLEQQGKYEEAEIMHRQTLSLREKALGKDHPSTLGSMNNLAEVLRQQGKYEEAEIMHRQTLSLREKVLGKDHLSTLDSINNLAVVLDQQGKYEEAEIMHQQTLSLTEKVLGKDHPSTLESINNLALVLRQQGKYEEAEIMHRQTLSLREKVLGKDHPSTLSSMNNLAIVLEQQGKYEEAEIMHRQTLSLREKVLGKDHPSTLGSMNNLTEVLRQQGKYDEAEKIQSRMI